MGQIHSAKLKFICYSKLFKFNIDYLINLKNGPINQGTIYFRKILNCKFTCKKMS